MAPRARMSGRGVLVIGAAGGIGRAVCRRFAREGAVVACLDIDDRGAADIASHLGEPAFPLVADATDEAQLRDAISCMARRTTLDVLASIVGGNGPTERAGSTPVEGWERTQAVNVRTAFLAAKQALPYLIERRGAIVNMSSALAFVGWPDDCAYGPAKSAVVQLTKGMALDYGPHVRVNCVCPGAVETAMTVELLDPSLDQTEALAEYGSIHPLYGRLARPEEIADAVFFLASDDASAITGVPLVVDGGFLARA